MPEAILAPRATLKWPSRHKLRVYCDIEEALLNLDLDEPTRTLILTAATHGTWSSAYASPNLSWARTMESPRVRIPLLL